MSRPYVVTMHRKRQMIGKPRHYARLETAFPRCVERLIQGGEPGDVYEVAHADFGFQIGTVKVRAGGRVDLQFSKELIQ